MNIGLITNNTASISTGAVAHTWMAIKVGTSSIAMRNSISVVTSANSVLPPTANPC